MDATASYTEGYDTGYKNAAESGKAVIGLHYMPTAHERAQSINFHGDDNRRAGWLAGWTAAAEPFRTFQERALGITTAAQWHARR